MAQPTETTPPFEGRESPVTPPPDGWTVDDLDAWPETHIRHELTDGALTVSPSPSSLHQIIVAVLTTTLGDRAPVDMAVTQGVEVRFTRQTTRIPDVLVVRSDDPRRHWFAPAEVLLAIEVESPGNHLDDRLTKPALYARYGIPHYWRIETDPLRVVMHHLAERDVYTQADPVSRIQVDEPFAVDLVLADRLPAWARPDRG